MPFTLAHPAIVLPLIRKARPWLSASGLILGSMAPDYEYFFRLQSGGGYGHTLPGVVLLDLPLCLLIAAMFHGVVKRPLTRYLPKFLRTRLGWMASQPWPLRNLWSPRVIGAVLVGCLSHLLWDDITHSRGWSVQHFWPLRAVVADFFVYYWLQLVSSLLGLAALAWFVWKLPRTTRIARVHSRSKLSFWIANLLITSAFWGVFMLMNRGLQGVPLLTGTIVTGISAATISLLLTSALPRFSQASFPPNDKPA